MRDYEKENLLAEIKDLKQQIKWYQDTYEKRSILGIFKDWLLKKFKTSKKENKQSKTTFDKKNIIEIENIPINIESNANIGLNVIENTESQTNYDEPIIPSDIKVSVIIPTYNRSVLLPKLIECWKKVHSVTRYKYELIFSDDGSNDNSLEILEKESELPIIIIKNDHGGAAKARNSAIMKATGEKLLIIGDDIFPNPEIINQHYEKLLELPLCKAVLGEVIWHKDLEINTLMKHITELGLEQFSFICFAPHDYVDFRQFYTCNISIDRAFVLSENVIFDESFYKVNFEDIELGYRLSKKGMQVYYYPEAVAEHYHSYKSVSGFCKRQETAGEMAVVFRSLHTEEIEWVVQVDTILKLWNTFLFDMNKNINKPNFIFDLVSSCQFVEDNKNVDKQTVEHHLSEIYRVLFRFYYEKGIIYKKLNLQDVVYDNVFFAHYWPRISDHLKNLNKIIELPNYKKLINIEEPIILTIQTKDIEHLNRLRLIYKDSLNYLNFIIQTDANFLSEKDFLYAPEKDFTLQETNMMQILLFLQIQSDIDIILLSLGLEDLPNIGISTNINNNLIFRNSIKQNKYNNNSIGKVIRLISEKSCDTSSLNSLFDNINFEIDNLGYFFKNSLPSFHKKSIYIEKQNCYKKTKKIVFVFPIYIAVGGVEKNTIEIIKELSNEFDFVIITFERLSKAQGSLHNQYLESSLGVYDLTEMSRHEDISNYLEALRDIYNPDLVWICNGSPWLVENTLEIRQLFNQSAIIDQQAYDTKEGWVQLYKSKNCGLISFDRFIAINSKIQEVFIESSGIDRADIDLIYSVISIEKREKAIVQDNSELRKKFNLDEHQKYFVFIGRLNEQKSPFDLLMLIKLIISKYNNEYKFILVGSGELSNQIDEFIFKNSLNQHIIRIPYVENTFEISKISEGILFTSLYEGLSIALLEALSVGTPGISTDVGDTKLIFEKFKNGIVFSTIGNIEEYFEKFIDFINNISIYKNNAEATKEEVAKMFCTSTVASQYSECFNKAINTLNKA
ncbi:MAG: glycosyltransferase [Bacteroidota bacterium]